MKFTLFLSVLVLTLAAPQGAVCASSAESSNPPLLLAGGPKKQKGIPPGQRKRLESGKGLSPGWRKKLAAGEVLSESDYQRAAPIPVENVRSYPPLRPNEELVRIEGKIVRLMKNTREIIEVLDSF